ncbi:MAG: 30S ribosomal protein S20 [Parcubacteria group bacterium CG08_land_8_20_14_0_20_48_21]|nr:MAG: 30S ribosomal protein S20 [Parcubacteria group bacterium CG2_30_48_51]PIS32675.1 MAG: 30S ribosomal protein S20 [Parcubacteria group bacterium CG08_land_8_20_14_0_20_48_21]PIW79016.1 MAG: 30S ribosomal protein S20 [Parcubacteria group bacterium CG_4_8_14_3_um_filter_48_16]PIY77953.1 MAG: 30S ribosomal protein S20 [Parcubacteria group bacterium CG_4_10_14_0_8_um_filter_48_154]PIZ77555.1 MAG: 30S ribosomal protein S20 [bacterium CG_4_10_14_0_2_um_filter_48_144]PJC39677.1 MAG: 30S ribosom
MPQKNAAKKALRQSLKHATRNQKIQTELKMTLKKSRQFIDAKKDGVKTKVADTIKLLDKAVKKGIIKKNTAARKKSRLMQRLHAAAKASDAKTSQA